MKFTRVIRKNLSPNITMVWAWQDMRELGYLGADDQYPHCCLYVDGVLTSNLYFSPETVTAERIEQFLKNTLHVHMLWKCNHCGEIP